MKGFLLIILLAAVIVVVVFTYKSGDSGEKSYPQKLLDAHEQAVMTAMEANITQIKNALNAYYSEKNEYPESLEMLVPDYIRSSDLLEDPWGTPFKLETDEDMNLILFSPGKDGVTGTTDDIKRRI